MITVCLWGCGSFANVHGGAFTLAQHEPLHSESPIELIDAHTATGEAHNVTYLFRDAQPVLDRGPLSRQIQETR
ncbi:MAG: hypothetical protein CM15mP103_02570 [Gammaproteobacteria bacterium]|nr:MAG: hypothetical protein CM15mP103_02570 [Gammaproteobacteria bacterium]